MFHVLLGCSVNFSCLIGQYGTNFGLTRTVAHVFDELYGKL